MPDLDSLSIQLTSSSKPAVKAIDDVILSLTRLNGALNNYSDGSKYINGLNSLVGGFNNLSKSINALDLGKLRSLSSTIGTLSSKAEALSRLNFVQTFAQLGNETQKTNSAVKSFTSDIAKEFGIPKEKTDELTQAVNKLFAATNNSQFDTAYKGLEKIVTEYARIEGAAKEAKEAHLNLRRELSSSSIYVSKDVMGNWGDDAKRNRAFTGIGNTTTNMAKGFDVVTTAEEQFGIQADNSYEAFEKLQNALADNSVELSKQEALYNLAGMCEGLKEKLLGVAAVQSTLSDDEFMVAPVNDPFDFMDDKTVTAKAENITSSIERVDNAIDNLQSETTQELANPFEGLIKGLNELQGINIPKDNFTGVSSLANSFRRFGTGDVNKAVEAIPRISHAFAQMATELSTLPEVSENVIRLAEAMSRFARQTNSATASTNKFTVASTFLKGAFGSIFASSKKTKKGFTSLASVFGRLYANFFLLIRAARLLGNAMNYSSSMTEAANVVSVAFGSQSEKLNEFADTAIKDFGMAKLSASQFASRFQSMGKTMGISAEQIGAAHTFISEKIKDNELAYDELGDSVADMSINLTKLTADMASLYNQDYESVAEDMAAIYTGMTRPLRKYGLDLTEATLKEWAMSQGLDSNLDKMTQAEKTMLRYQYVMANASIAMGDFAKTADTWANAMRTVKQLLQEFSRVIGEALINALRPALLAFRQFMFNMVSAAESGLNALGKLLGWKQIDFGGASLIEDTEGYADALDDAAGAAKKLNGQLRGIDELNNLTSNNGSGGGLGGDALSNVNMDDLWENIEESDKYYESTVKSFYDFGERVSKALKTGLDNIDWPGIYEKVGTGAKNLASFLNGIFQPSTFESIGKTIAGGFNTLFTAALEFGKEFDFNNLGVTLAEGINGFFRNFDFSKAAETINTWAKGLLNFISGFLTGDENGNGGLDFGAIWDGIKDFFSNLDIEGLGLILLPLINKLIKGLVAGAVAVLKKLFATVVIPAATKELKDFFSVIFANPAGFVRTVGKFFIRVFQDALAIAFAAIGGYQIGNGIGEVFALLSGDYDMAEDFENSSVMAKLGVDMKLWEESWFETFDDIKKFFTENPWSSIIFSVSDGEDVMKSLTKITDNIKTKFSEAYDEADKKFGEWWDNNLVPAFDFPQWEGLFKTIPEAWSKCWDEAIVFYTETIPKWWEEDVKPNFSYEKIYETFKTIGESLTDAWTKGKDATLEKLEEIKNNVTDFFKKEVWEGHLKGAVDALSEMWSKPLEVAKGFFNSVADFAEGFINGLLDGFKKLISAKNFFSGSNDTLEIGHITIPRFANGGYPQVGSLFIAGEAGSELVGNINGRTGVVSNGEISGIASTIRSTSDAEIQLLRQQNILLQGILEKEFGITDKEIFNSVRKSSREYTRSTGLLAF